MLQEADALRTLGRISLNVDTEIGASLMAATALYLAYASQNPFSGLDAISNAPLQEAFDRLKVMKLN